MEPFLKQLARLFYKLKVDENNGSSLEDTLFVFPSRRAAVFFTQYLTEITQQTFFAPTCYTIADFFASLAPKMEIEDKLGLLFRLYRCYLQVSTEDMGNKEEKFDNFLSFGEIILHDFNDVDNYMADAHALFTNISDLKDLEHNDYLDEAQIEALQNYLGYFHRSGKEIQALSARNWKILWPLYQAFKENLQQDGIAYDGMMHRAVVEQEEIPWTTGKEVVFIGFNALDEATRQLFTRLQKMGVADFYWDYQSKFLQDKANKAHYFAEDNLRRFPSKHELQLEALPKPIIHSIGIPSNVGQAKMAHEVLQAWTQGTTANGEKSPSTAVVLANEQLLVPLLYSLPPIENINVTMGYPLKNSSIKKLLEDCLQLVHSRNAEGFNFQQVNAVLQHPYIQQSSGLYINNLPAIFKRKLRVTLEDMPAEVPARLQLPEEQRLYQKGYEFMPILFPVQEDIDYLEYLNQVIAALLESVESALDKEFLLQTSLALTRMQGLMEHYPDMHLQATTYLQLIRQLINSISISFIGEPISGLQIMGMLETRCLDFERLIICSFNEGIFPKADTSHSLIPYSLRSCFGLPTTEHQDAVFAYNFYHLISRAREVYLLHDTRNDIEQGSGEESRFTKQLKFLYHYPIQEQSVNYPTTIPKLEELKAPKDATVMKSIHHFLTVNGLSPSSLNTYIECPFRFYLQNIKHIRIEKVASLDVANNDFGTIYHDVMEHIYQPLAGKMVTAEMLQKKKSDKALIDDLLKKAFIRTLYQLRDDSELPAYEKNYTYKGTQKLIADIIREYVQYSLQRDIERAPFIHLTEELPIAYHYEIPISEDHPDDKISVLMRGFVDRIDQSLDGKVQLWDYKTNKKTDKLKAFNHTATLFSAEPVSPAINRKELLQLCFYHHICTYNPAILDNLPGIQKKIAEIQGHLYFVRDTPKEEFNMSTQMSFPILNSDGSGEDWQKEFPKLLTKTIQEILNAHIPFQQTELEDACKYCDFKSICGK